MIFAPIISLTTGKIILYKPIKETDLNNFSGFSNPNSLQDLSNGYYLHDYSNIDQILYVIPRITKILLWESFAMLKMLKNIE